MSANKAYYTLMSFFSIIIPVYNTEAYLGECLNSILNQSCPDWECICVDDGSRDSSSDVLSGYSYTDNRFVIIHQDNHGQAFARNCALEIALGEYITYVDSDDLLLPDSLEDWATILGHHKSDVLVETGGFISFCNTCELVGEVYDETFHPCFPLPNSEDALDYFFFRSHVGGTTCGKVYRRQICGHLRFPVQLRYAEDSTYWLALFREELTWCAVDAKHYCYRRNREGSHSLTISPMEKVGYFENSVDHLVLLDEKGFSQKECVRFWEHSIGSTMRYVCGGPEECWCVCGAEGQQRFRMAARRAKFILGYYPFSWTMRIRVEVLRGRCERVWRLFETMWYGIAKRVFSR